jgi:hypothetical protein
MNWTTISSSQPHQASSHGAIAFSLAISGRRKKTLTQMENTYAYIKLSLSRKHGRTSGLIGLVCLKTHGYPKKKCISVAA